MNKSHLLISMILKHEGGYALIPGDSGGETYQGISRVNFPKWKGWAIIDKFKPLKNGQIITTVIELEELVEQFYKSAFYNKCKIDSIQDLFISAHVLDQSVNSGIPRGIKILQKAINNLGHDLVMDGKIGEKTLNACNSSNQKDLLNSLISERKSWYRSIVDNNPSQNKFLKGWLNRVDQVNTYITTHFK